jgi:phosphoribosylanthranilate isomerase
MLAGNIGVDNLEKVAKITKIVDVSGNLETNKSKDKKKIINFLNKVKEINDRN